jgi:hypothetical protein
MPFNKSIYLTFTCLLFFGPSLLAVQTEQVERLSALKHLEVTNITMASAAVCWITDGKSSSNWVELRAAGSDSVPRFYDDNTAADYVHFVTVTDLKPGTEYQYRVGSDSLVWDNNGTWYSFKTLQSASIVTPMTIYGQVADTENNPLDRVLIRIRIKRQGDDYSLSRTELTKGDGMWATIYSDFHAQDGSLYYPDIGDRVIIECFANYWSSTVDSSKTLNGSSPQFLGKLNLSVYDPGKVKKGDLDNNGAINIFDLINLLKVLSGSLSLDDGRLFLAADIDTNGVVNIFDLLALLRLLANGA